MSLSEDDFEIALTDDDQDAEEKVQEQQPKKKKKNKRNRAASSASTGEHDLAAIRKLVNRALGEQRVAFRIGKYNNNNNDDDVLVHLDNKFARFCSIKGGDHDNTAASLFVDVAAGNVRQYCFVCKETKHLVTSKRKKKKRKKTKRPHADAEEASRNAGQSLLDLVTKHTAAVEELRKERKPNRFDPTIWHSLVDSYNAFIEPSNDDDDEDEYDTRLLHQLFETAVTQLMNLHYCFIAGGAKVQTIEQQCNMVKRNDVWELNNNFIVRLPRECENSVCMHVRFLVGQTQPQNPIQIWQRNASIQQVDRVTFDPSTTEAYPVDARVFNLFRGLTISREDAAASVPQGHNIIDLVKAFIDHITDIWYHGDGKPAKFLLQWMASIVQRPWVKMPLIPAIKGGQGAGKSIVITHFLTSILGAEHVLHCVDADSILGNFQPEKLKTNLLTFLDECTFSGDKRQASKLKALISEKTRRWEAKFLNPMEIPNYSNHFAASNLDTMASVEHDDRRGFMSECDSIYSGPQTPESRAYFKNLLAVDVKHLAHYLYTLDLSDFVPESPPSTSYMRFQKKINFNSATDWIETQLRDVDASSLYNNENQPVVLHKNALYTQYKQEYAAERYTHPLKVSAFWKTVLAIVPEMHTSRQKHGSSRVRVIQFPSLDDARKSFISYVRESTWDWDDTVE